MKPTNALFLVVTIVASIAGPGTLAFVSPSTFVTTHKCNSDAMIVTPKSNDAFLVHDRQLSAPINNQRRSVTSVQTMSLFGLGGPELAVIAIAGLFLLGPSKIGEIVKSSGQMAGELKNELRDVPDEFKKGLAEGEVNAKSRNAKPMEKVPDDE
mmetsp:Transcript_21541/g.29999  ORF Transcript_21541/g.29999 Transcript_21541/m.29999 type:complete len:154 (+) Transcript_21541:82-543(+)